MDSSEPTTPQLHSYCDPSSRSIVGVLVAAVHSFRQTNSIIGEPEGAIGHAAMSSSVLKTQRKK